MNSQPTASSGNRIQDELEVLFEETVDLANRLKQNARQLHRGEPLSASGRILLQSLQLRGPQTVPQLAQIRSTSRQNIQVLVDRLAATGYIAFESNPGHKRSVFVTLTDSGRSLLSSANTRETGLLTSLLPHTTEVEVRAAAELLRKLRLMMGGGNRRRTQSETESVKFEIPVLEKRAFVQPTEDDEMPVNLL